MLGLGKEFPAFKLKAVVGDEPETAFTEISKEHLKGKWAVLFFYPKDFTFVCPTEIRGFANLKEDFQKRGAEIFACSTDSEFVHLAWRQNSEFIRGLPIPMLSDIRRDLSSALGILEENEGVAQRATYIVDPQGIIRFVSVNDGKVGRNPDETLRTLDALQSDGLCPTGWKKGQATLDVAKLIKAG